MRWHSQKRFQHGIFLKLKNQRQYEKRNRLPEAVFQRILTDEIQRQRHDQQACYGCLLRKERQIEKEPRNEEVVPAVCVLLHSGSVIAILKSMPSQKKQ